MSKSLSLVALVLTFVTGSAFADGFKCTTTTVESRLKGELNIKAFNEVNPELGTRNASVMVLSDPSVQYGRKTIATFKNSRLASTGTLVNEGAVFMANVDSRVSGVERGGELILGTKLSELKSVKLDIAFSYARPVAEGAIVGAKLTLTKENGKKIVRMMDCTRYLKN